MSLDFLRKEGVNEDLIKGVEDYQKKYPIAEESKQRIPVPHFPFFGKEVWEDALSALLCGQNLLLVGPKATGKNVLAENLAQTFGRPMWNVSFHINMDAAAMLGTDTFKNGQVEFRPGPVYRCAQEGGFGVFDEINMARNEAMAVLHSLLDYRRTIDIPGYEMLKVNPACRFIATMNYGYAGTREMNEALMSRFAVIKMDPIKEEPLTRLIRTEFPSMKKEAEQAFVQIFLDLEKKCKEAEISDKALDLRGLIDSLHLMQSGLEAHRALAMGITNKSFDEYEPALITDVINLHIPGEFERKDIFED
ncbi:MAG: MoxR family ATPase [Acidaminococcus sp.]|jgi:MoxR-like ATPase|nr:MoxR family ATPase [Acidaminococcus sp.]MCI2100659.1 MoxR family ATPase [Acidaminococcus sp.]MCI2114980.1 MoxR family ATPase [Acidaminococcus sp.]MCI2117617.1 MoxR family ATPase [Acidaminococcus sp.]